MTKAYISLFLLLFSQSVLSQIKGNVTDTNGEPLPFVNIYIENSTIGTTSNEKGMYTLHTNERNPTIVFQFLGYKTEKRTLNIDKHPYILDISLSEESYQLSAVTVSNKDNPANAIIRNAIKHKEENSQKANRFEADFYSKGFLKLKDVPKKILGQEVGDLDGNIDTLTRSGIVYQSETISKIKFEKPHHVKENIIASKVAGNSNGFSFNTAASANFDFYDNYLNFNAKMISPIADNAFSYYKFTLESTFYDDKNRLINKIKISPKRNTEPVFDGYIYILEDSWAIYAVEVTAKGYRMQEPVISQLLIKQYFSYNDSYNMWAKNLQTVELQAKVLMIQLSGAFSYVYNNYQFKDAFAKKEFKGEVRLFQNDANKKDSLFWANARQIPLTDEEATNYRKKDSIEAIHTSDKYIDSVETRRNKFKFWDIFTGYSYRKSAKKMRFSYNGLFDLESIGFNTVQGFFAGTGFNFYKWNEDNLSSTHIGGDVQYSFAEKKLRATAEFTRVFNQINYPTLSILGGSQVKQFNPDNPISETVNSIASLFFKDNYMKLYNNEFLQVQYGQDIANGVYLQASFDYNNRKPLWNNSNYDLTKKSKPYTSNNPLLPFDYEQNFEKHYVSKLSLLAKFQINQRYTSYPKQKIKHFSSQFPTFQVKLTNTFSASKKEYQFQTLEGSITYTPSFDNKGETFLYLNGGLFFNAKNIHFIDYKHFNGNQTHVQFTENPNTSFYLLPYYTYSTNENYAELHIRHRFRGYITNKIPLFNKLQWNVVTGFHQLTRTNAKPYQELTIGLENIGWKSFRFFRIDYVRAYEGGFRTDGLMFGISLQ